MYYYNNHVAFQEEGFQPHSIVNFLSLLGWGPSNAAGQRVQPSASATSEPLASAPGQSQDMSHEILGLHDLIRTFTLEGVNRKPAVVNEAKLLWMNRHYFKQKLTYSINELAVQLQEQVCKSHEYVNFTWHADHLFLELYFAVKSECDPINYNSL